MLKVCFVRDADRLLIPNVFSSQGRVLRANMPPKQYQSLMQMIRLWSNKETFFQLNQNCLFTFTAGDEIDPMAAQQVK